MSFVVAWVVVPGWSRVTSQSSTVQRRDVSAERYSSAPPLLWFSKDKGGPLLLKKLKHAIGKNIMKERRDIFRFLTCSTKSDSQGAGSELKRNLLLSVQLLLIAAEFN